jgi:hypothetical protein
LPPLGRTLSSGAGATIDVEPAGGYRPNGSICMQRGDCRMVRCRALSCSNP